MRQAAIGNDSFMGPAGLIFAADQCQRFAGADTVCTKRALAALEVDGRITAIADDNNLFRAGTNAVVATGTAIRKKGFSQCPGRPDFRLGARSTAEETAAAGINHVLLTRFHFLDTVAQHLVDFRTGLDGRQQGFPVGDCLLVFTGLHRGGTGKEK